jgi:hypothetical protein
MDGRSECVCMRPKDDPLHAAPPDPSRAEPEKEVMPSVPEEQAPTRDSLRLSGVPVETPRRVVGGGGPPQEPTRGQQIAAKFRAESPNLRPMLYPGEIKAISTWMVREIDAALADQQAELEALRKAAEVLCDLADEAREARKAAEARVREMSEVRRERDEYGLALSRIASCACQTKALGISDCECVTCVARAAIRKEGP